MMQHAGGYVGHRGERFARQAQESELQGRETIAHAKGLADIASLAMIERERSLQLELGDIFREAASNQIGQSPAPHWSTS